MQANWSDVVVMAKAVLDGEDCFAPLTDAIEECGYPFLAIRLRQLFEVRDLHKVADLFYLRQIVSLSSKATPDGLEATAKYIIGFKSMASPSEPKAKDIKLPEGFVHLKEDI